MHSNKNSLSISGEESAGLTFGLPPHPLEDVQAKKKHPTTTQQSSLLQKCGKTSLERTSDYKIWKWFPYLDQHSSFGVVSACKVRSKAWHLKQLATITKSCRAHTNIVAMITLRFSHHYHFCCVYFVERKVHSIFVRTGLNLFCTNQLFLKLTTLAGPLFHRTLN